MRTPTFGVKRLACLAICKDADNLPRLMAIAASDADPEVRRTSVGARWCLANRTRFRNALVHALGADAHWMVRVR